MSSSSALGKVSQRPSLSCTECSRRKTKCDKRVPCGGCIKRGKSHLCHVEAHISRKDITKIEESHTPEAPLTPDAARIALHHELQLLRNDSDAARSRADHIEQLLDVALAGAGAGSNQQLYLPPSIEPMQQPTASSSRATFPPLPSSNSFNVNDSYDLSLNTPGPYALPPPDPASSGPNNAGFARQSSSRYPDSSERERASQEKDTSKGEQREEVEASIALEFLALGRNRPYGEKDSVSDTYPNAGVANGSGQSSQNLPFATDSHLAGSLNEHVPPPSAAFPTIASIEAVAPNRQLSDALVAFALDWLGWHSAAVHAPTFKQETAAFWSVGPQRFEVASSAWLALYFAVLTVGIGNLPAEHARHLGLNPDTTSETARTWFHCSLSLLNMYNWMQNHHISCVQAVIVLIVSAQQHSRSNLVPTLLATAISIAQQLGYHRICSDAEWEQSMRDQPLEVRAKSLVGREIRKRMFWQLIAQDWFSIPFRRTNAIQPSQVTTPLPNNLHDEDLMTGQMTVRPMEEYTVASSIILWVQIARCLQAVFEHLDQNENPSYEFVLKTDEELEKLLDNIPSWMRDDGREVHPSVQWMRNAFEVSSQHKVLTLHRPFLHRAFHDKRYMSSRNRAVSASRKILQVADRAIATPLWTIAFHIVAAGCLVMLDIFQRANLGETDVETERSEVQQAIQALRKVQDQSGIARRGVILLSNLLAEEERLRNSSGATSDGTSDKKRKSVDAHDTDRAKKTAVNALSTANNASSSPSTTTSRSTPSNSDANGGNRTAMQTFDPRATSEFLARLHDWDPLDGALVAHQQQQTRQAAQVGSNNNGSVGSHQVEALSALPWENRAAIEQYYSPASYPLPVPGVPSSTNNKNGTGSQPWPV